MDPEHRLQENGKFNKYIIKVQNSCCVVEFLAFKQIFIDLAVPNYIYLIYFFNLIL